MRLPTNDTRGMRNRRTRVLVYLGKPAQTSYYLFHFTPNSTYPIMSIASILPIDAPNRKTITQGHPTDWTGPQPKKIYDFVIFGGGPAGLNAAFAAIDGGHTVAIVERNLLGGTCVNFGCTPSKTFLRAAKAVSQANEGKKFGYTLNGDVHVNFGAVMTRVREMRTISGEGDAAIALTALGIDVFLGDGRFVASDMIEVNGQQLKFKKALVATGSRPVIPPVPGLESTHYLTNETVFELTEMPQRLVCIGAGTINCELAQAFRRLGCEVDLIGNRDRVVPEQDAAASKVLEASLLRDGVRLHLGVKATNVDGVQKLLTLSDGSALAFDVLLVAAGRKVNLEGIGLEAAGVVFTAEGVQVDDFLQSTNPAIYAAGDVATSLKLTHLSAATAKIAVANALNNDVQRVSDLVIPSCVYTTPEIAHVGISGREAAEMGMVIYTHKLNLSTIERARIDGEEEGFASLYVHEGVIVGATLVSAHAGESLPVLTLAVIQKLRPADLAATIFCFPTQAEAIQRVAAQAAMNDKRNSGTGEL